MKRRREKTTKGRKGQRERRIEREREKTTEGREGQTNLKRHIETRNVQNTQKIRSLRRCPSKATTERKKPKREKIYIHIMEVCAFLIRIIWLRNIKTTTEDTKKEDK